MTRDPRQTALPSTTEQKNHLRSTIRGRRSTVSATRRHTLNNAITSNTLTLLEQIRINLQNTPHPLEHIAVFIGTEHEPAVDLTPLFRWCVPHNITLYAPRVKQLTSSSSIPKLDWVSIAPTTDFNSGAFGIDEPHGVAEPSKFIADAYVIPALAVDKLGYRLGQGGGYYDATVASIRDIDNNTTSVNNKDIVPIIAVVDNKEILESIPHDSWDCKVTYVVTPDMITPVTLSV